MISKTKISKRIKRKTNPELVETIALAKNNGLLDLAKKLSGPTRLQTRINLGQLDEIKENKIIVVGRVLGSGDIKKKISIAALGFSEQAKEKLNKNGSEMKTIKQEIKDLKKLEGIKII
ncbi:MAG: uL15 family ribosomal protein [Candidatus Pacearchaeota archaeon]